MACSLALALAWAPPPATGAVVSRTPRLAYRCTLAVTDLGTYLRVVYRLRSDAPLRRWRLRMWDRKVAFFAGTVPSDDLGRVIVRKRTRDFKGPDALRARARNLATGRVCAVSITT